MPVRSERKIRYEAVRNGMVQAASSMLIMGEDRNPGITQLQRLGKQQGIKNAPEILANVQRAVANWACFAEQPEVAKPQQGDLSQDQSANGVLGRPRPVLERGPRRGWMALSVKAGEQPTSRVAISVGELHCDLASIKKHSRRHRGSGVIRSLELSVWFKVSRAKAGNQIV